MNRYLARRKDRMMRDGRNPYGSRGGYVSSHRDRAMGEMGDMTYDMRGRGRPRKYDRDMRGDMHYPEMEIYGVGGMRPRMDYGYHMEDYGTYGDMRSNRRDYGDYNDYGGDDEEYKKKLKHWTEKLKKKDRFDWTKENVIQRAREMHVKFEEINEDEFYAVYLMMCSDFSSYANDPNTYISMAKDWLYDDDIAVSPSEKLCIYLYEIVLGEE